MEKINKIAIIHHNADLDGLTSGYLAQKVFKNFINDSEEKMYEIIGYNYGKNAEIDTWLNIEKGVYTEYIFIDITPPLEFLYVMEDILESGLSKIHIFDHHQNVYYEIMELCIFGVNENYHFNDNECGSLIFYNFFKNENNTKIFLLNQKVLALSYENIIFLMEEINSFFKNTELFSLVELVDSYDLWKWKKTNNLDALALHEAILQTKTVSELEKIYDLFPLEEILMNGESIIKQKRKEAKNIKKIYTSIEGISVCIINNKANTYDIDEVENDLLNDSEKQISCIVFYKDIDFVDDKINISLRCLPDSTFDCCEFIKKITNGNGGGHKNASGGSLSLSKLLKLIEK